MSGHKVGIGALFRSVAAAVLAGLLLTAAPATAQTFPKLAGNPVVDQADIIPAAEETALNTQLLELQQKTGHQPVVETVSDPAGRHVSDHGSRTGRQGQPGDRKRLVERKMV